MTLLFAIAEVNGTLERLTARAVRLCRGHAGLLPIMFFVLGFVDRDDRRGRHTRERIARAARDGDRGSRAAYRRC